MRAIINCFYGIILLWPFDKASLIADARLNDGDAPAGLQRREKLTLMQKLSYKIQIFKPFQFGANLESAYSNYLTHHGKPSTPESRAAFDALVESMVQQGLVAVKDGYAEGETPSRVGV